jgi:hypothetical protein
MAITSRLLPIWLILRTVQALTPVWTFSRPIILNRLLWTQKQEMRLLAGIIESLKALEDRALITDKEQLVKMWTKHKNFNNWTILIYAETTQWVPQPWTLKEATVMTNKQDKRDTHHRTKWGNQPLMAWMASYNKTQMANFNWLVKRIQLEERKDRTNLISTRFT